MLVKNSFEYDARVTKEAESLVRAGHDVTVVAIHLPEVTAAREVRSSGVRVVRVSRAYGPLARLVRASTITPGAGSDRSATVATTAASAPRRLAANAARSLARPAAFIARAVNAAVLNHRFVTAALATDPEVVHAHDLNTLYAGTLIKRATGARLVYDAHELAANRNGMGPVRRAWASTHERRGLRDVDMMITTTNAWADYLVGRYRIPRPTVVRNVPELQEIRQGFDLRAELGIPADQRVLLYQGSIQRNRGIEQIIDALDLLPGFALVIIGYGAERPVLERVVAARQLSERVRFFGPIPNDQLLHYTASVDVGMCCIRNSSLSYYWSLPNKLFEYVMAGVPVVASDFPEMGGFVRSEDVGEVCDPDDPAQIAAAVRGIVDDPERLAEIRAHTREVTSRHNWDREEAVLLRAYERVTDAPAARGWQTPQPRGRKPARSYGSRSAARISVPADIPVPRAAGGTP